MRLFYKVKDLLFIVIYARNYKLKNFKLRFKSKCVILKLFFNFKTISLVIKILIFINYNIHSLGCKS